MIQNKVARVVTRLDWSTPTKVLLSQLGWLRINHLVFYHSVLIIYKVKKERSPKNIHSMFNQSYQYNTRQAESGLIKPVLMSLLKDPMLSARCVAPGRCCSPGLSWVDTADAVDSVEARL